MDQRSLEELELPRVLELAAALASSEPGRGRVLGLRPAVDSQVVAERLDATRDMVAFLADQGPITLSGLVDLRPALARLERSTSPLSASELFELFGAIRTLVALRRHRTAAIEADRWPAVTELFRQLPDLSELGRLADRLFDRNGDFRDEASPELGRLRRRLQGQRRSIASRADSLLEERPELYRDSTVAIRGDRYCLPMRSDARGRIPTVVHDRSKTGQTYFVEPLDLVELNNELAALGQDEAREIERLLSEATARIAEHLPDLRSAYELALRIDTLQALARFADLTEAHRPATGAGIALERARHPLLDERLAPLRRSLFDEASERRTRNVVPVDILLAEDERVLILSGPNAGGKTAAMKLVGLFAMMAQTGLLLPASEESRLPIFSRISSEIGDHQDLLEDLSSFSSGMARIAEILSDAGPGLLVLLDEIGAATDPEEGGALAVAVLEAVAAAGGTAIVTTHLGRVKDWGSSSDGVRVAAMEFDGTSGRPTYRILPDRIGRSRAVALAEKAGLPAETLARTRELLGSDFAAREQAIEALEAARLALDEERGQLAAIRIQIERERRQLAEQRGRAEEQAKTLRVQVSRTLGAVRTACEKRLQQELEGLRASSGDQRSERELRRAIDRARTRAMEPARKAESEAEEQLGAPAASRHRPTADGERVRVEGLGTVGRLRTLGRGGRQSVVEVGGKTIHVDTDRLESVEEPAPPKPAVSFSPASTRPTVSDSIELLGKTVDQALDELDGYIDNALLAGRREIRVIHGFGTGRLRDGIQRYLDEHPGVVSRRPGGKHEGAGGATVVVLDV